MPESFFFPVYSGLLTNEHKTNIGPALWEFLWLISKTTKEFKEGEETWGIVLGGKPIKVSEVAEELGGSDRTVKRNISRLKEFRYIKTKRTPYGEIYYVRNSKKFKSKRSAKNGTSEQREVPDLSGDVPHLSKRSAKNGTSNKDIKDIKDDIKDDHMINNPFLEYEKAFGVLSPKLIDEINYWIDESQFQDPEAIICEAIKRSQKQAPRQPAKYIDSVLKNWHNMELYTLETIKEYNEKFDKKMNIGAHKKKNEIDWEEI